MARTSQRLSLASNASKKHKRAVSGEAGIPDRRKKLKTESTASDDEAEHESPTEDEAASDYASESETPPESSDDEDDYDSEEERPKRRKKPTPRKTTAQTSRSDGADVWREGVSAGLGPGKQVIIKKPKARSPGKVPYKDETLHPNTFLFLADLKANNDRQWLKMNDPDFRQAERDWFAFVEKLTERLVEIDDTIPELPVKDVIFRIYRDVRFSPDPTPYKPFFSVAFSRTGRKGPYAHYYVQIGPKESFVGGGLWHPDADPLAALRRSVDSNSRGLKDVLLDADIRKEFLNNAPNNDAKVCKAFTQSSSNAENALKTKPKGYDADHPDIDLLRLRNYTIGRKLTQEELTGNGLDRVASLLACMRPFITYLNSVVMPDPDDEDASNNGAEEEDPPSDSAAASGDGE